MTHTAVDSRAPMDAGGCTNVAPTVGRTELGTVSIGDGVVSKIAARTAFEVPDAGTAATRVLGRSVPGAGRLGVRGTDLDGLPKTSADVDGTKTFIDMQISVRWPASIPAVAGRVRSQVQDRVAQLTGLSVDEVRITVGDLVTHISPPPRVQ
jgi:uncharacterized alkaline shock family protein YloU